jgi:hypothetical protein
MFSCQPTAGGCDTVGEWIADTIAAASISSGDVAFSQIAQASGASVLVGRGSASGAGDFQEITLGANLTMSGTELSASAGSSFDPGTTLRIYSDFVGSGSGATLGETQISVYGWLSGSAAQEAGTASHPGLIRAYSTTSDNSGGEAYIANTVASVFATTAFTSNEWTYDTLVLPGSNSTVITSSGMWIGLQNDGAGGAGPGTVGAIVVRYDTDLSDSTWMFVVCNASGASGCNSGTDSTNIKVVASTITPVAGTWNRIRMRHDTTGVGGNPTIYFRVNNETEKTFCSSGCDDTLAFLPTGVNLLVTSELMGRDTTAESMDLDYIYIDMTLSRY